MSRYLVIIFAVFALSASTAHAQEADPSDAMFVGPNLPEKSSPLQPIIDRLRAMKPRIASKVLGAMSLDQSAKIIAELPAREGAKLLQSMPPQKAASILQMLAIEEEEPVKPEQVSAPKLEKEQTDEGEDDGADG